MYFALVRHMDAVLTSVKWDEQRDGRNVEGGGQEQGLVDRHAPDPALDLGNGSPPKLPTVLPHRDSEFPLGPTPASPQPADLVTNELTDGLCSHIGTTLIRIRDNGQALREGIHQRDKTVPHLEQQWRRQQMEREFLTRPEVAELLRTPVATLHQWAYRGYGPPFIKVGRRTLYRSSEVKAWLKAQVREPQAG